MLNKLVFKHLRQPPVRTCLSVLAIGVEVTMILTLVGISYGTLDETARRAHGVGADIIVRPPASSIISLSSSPMSEKLVAFLMKQPHITFATGTMGQPLGGFNVLTGHEIVYSWSLIASGVSAMGALLGATPQHGRQSSRM